MIVHRLNHSLVLQLPLQPPERRLNHREVSLNVDVPGLSAHVAGTLKSTGGLWRMLSKARRITRERVSLLQYVYAFGFLHL